MSDLEDLRYDAEQDDLRDYLHREGTCGGPAECGQCEDEAERELLRQEEEDYWADRPEEFEALNARLRSLSAQFSR